MQDDANKYKTREDFFENSRDAYDTASRYKLLDEIFKNHKNQGGVKSMKSLKKLKWAKEMLQAEADKCETIDEFRKKYNKAFSIAQKRKIIGELFKDKPNQGYKRKVYMKSFESFAKNDIR